MVDFETAAKKCNCSLDALKTQYEVELQKLMNSPRKDGMKIAGKIFTVEDLALSAAQAAVKGADGLRGASKPITFYMLGQSPTLQTKEGKPYKFIQMLLMVDEDKFFNRGFTNRGKKYAYTTATLWASQVLRPGFYAGELKKGAGTNKSIDKIQKSTESFDVEEAKRDSGFLKFKIINKYPAQEIPKKNGDGVWKRRNFRILFENANKGKEIQYVSTTIPMWMDLEDTSGTFEGCISTNTYTSKEDGEQKTAFVLTTPPMKIENGENLTLEGLSGIDIIADFFDIDAHLGNEVLLVPAFGNIEIMEVDNKSGEGTTAFSQVTDINGNELKIVAFDSSLLTGVVTEEGKLVQIMRILARIAEYNGDINAYILAAEDISGTEELGEVTTTPKPKKNSQKKLPEVKTLPETDEEENTENIVEGDGEDTWG